MWCHQRTAGPYMVGPPLRAMCARGNAFFRHRAARRRGGRKLPVVESGGVMVLYGLTVSAGFPLRAARAAGRRGVNSGTDSDKPMEIELTPLVAEQEISRETLVEKYAKDGETTVEAVRRRGARALAQAEAARSDEQPSQLPS